MRAISRISDSLKYTVKYSAVHSCYWSIFCSSCSFAAVYLLSMQYSNSQIGLVLAAANLISVFLQPAVAAFADRSRKVFLKNFIAAFLGAACTLAAARFLIPGAPPLLLALLLILELVVLFSLQPLVISLGIRIIDRGVPINFGLARGMGSMAYAVLSVLLGFLVDRAGTTPLAAVSVILYIILGILVLTFAREQFRQPAPVPVHPERPAEKAAAGHREPGGRPAFLTKNRSFFILLIAVTLAFCSHSVIGNYLIQITESVGGTAKEMGIASGISAAIELPAMVFFGLLVKKIRCSTILKSSLCFFLMKAVLTLAATNVTTLYAAQIFQACAYAQFIPASIFYVNQIIEKEDAVKGQAYMTSAAALGSVAASLLGGWLLDGPGVSGMLAAGAAAALLGFIIGCFSIQKTEAIAAG